jgi:hypothetical protein
MTPDSRQIMDFASLAGLTQQGGAGQNPDPNGQGGKQNFLRGTDGGGSMTPQGYSASLPFPQQFPYELKAGTINTRTAYKRHKFRPARQRRRSGIRERMGHCDGEVRPDPERNEDSGGL